MSRKITVSLTAWISVAFAGILSLAFSLWGVLAFLGLGLSDRILDDVLAIFPMLALPVYLLVIRSFRVAVISMWAFFFMEWARCCIIGWPVLCHNPVDSISGQILLSAAILLNLSFVLFSANEGVKVKNLKDAVR
jgi:hypothetical protein